jgi:hypothetical protein
MQMFRLTERRSVQIEQETTEEARAKLSGMCPLQHVKHRSLDFCYPHRYPVRFRCPRAQVAECAQDIDFVG